MMVYLYHTRAMLDVVGEWRTGFWRYDGGRTQITEDLYVRLTKEPSESTLTEITGPA